MTPYQHYSYIVLVGICFMFSLVYRTKKKSVLFIYLGTVMLVELVSVLKIIDNNILHSYSTLIYILFFTYYFSKISKKFVPIFYVLGGIAFLSTAMIKLTYNTVFPIEMGIILSSFYILSSILYFYESVNINQAGFITDKESFWVSFAILFWSIFFIFRVVPMYGLAKKDIEFLKQIQMVYKIAVFCTYILFAAASTRKRI